MAKADAATLRENRRRMMLEEPLIKVVPIIAFPMIISQLVNSFYGMADTYFVSKLGEAATAAIGVNDSLTHFTQSVAMGFGAGASSYISRLLGAKRDQEASQVATTILAICMGFMVLLSVFGYIFMSPLIDLLGATPTAKPYSMDYARFILLGTPFTGATFVLSQLLRSEGSTRYAMIGTVSGCVVNIALDPLFISVLGLEVAGAALATSISKFISFAVLMIPFLKKSSILEIKPAHFKPRWSVLSEVVRMGIPTFLRSSCMSVATTVLNNVARGFGDYALAGISVANKVMRFIDSVVMGFSQGVQPVVGFCWGAKNYKRVRESIWFILGVGGGAALVLSMGASFFTTQIITAMAGTSSAQTIELGAAAMRYQCYATALHMVVMLSSGLFQSLGWATSAALLGLSRSLIVLVPASLILPRLFGEAGLAWTRAATDIISFLFLALPLILVLLRKLSKLIREQELEKAAEA